MVIYCSVIIYKYYSRLGFLPTKHKQKVKDISNEIFNNITHLIKSCLNVNCLQYGFVMYNDKVLILKQQVITPITGSMITEAFLQRNEPVNNLTTDDMIFKF